MEGILERGVEGTTRKDKAAARREEQLTRERERQDKIITNAKPEESILIDEMQNNNGEEVERRHTRAELNVEDLQDGPVIGNDACVIVVGDDMVANENEVVLRDSAGSGSDTRYVFLPRVPAQVHGRSPDSTTNSPDHKKARATTSARLDVEARPSGTTRVLDTDDNMDDNDKRQATEA